ncbi:MAG TPA: DNRLRE domain-containing protein [Chitinophagaceae bacterium]
MKQNKSLLVCCLLLILSSTATRAQYYFGEYINQTVTLRSDLPSKSVLVSNLIADRAGDMSPVIGAANWADSGRQLECRSLLKFNYIFLPEVIINDPSSIISAELILCPVHVVFSPNDIGKPGRFLVRWVLENWEDSATMWINQPLSDSSVQVKKIIKVKNKNYPVSVDVTKLVINMLRYGNNGFMICPENPDQQSIASGQLFASPKYEDENLRPLLVINYRKMADPSLAFKYWNETGNYQRAVNFTMMQPGTGSYPVMEPVKEPVKEPVQTNPVKD